MATVLYQARILENPKTPDKSAWEQLYDEDGEPIQGTDLEEVRADAKEVVNDDPRLVIAQIVVSYIKP